MRTAILVELANKNPFNHAHVYTQRSILQTERVCGMRSAAPTSPRIHRRYYASHRHQMMQVHLQLYRNNNVTVVTLLLNRLQTRYGGMVLHLSKRQWRNVGLCLYELTS